MIDEETKETHPSYGMIQFSRISGAGHLFGSPLSQHFGTIHVRIAKGERCHDTGNDYYRPKGQLVEIELSAAQFAEAITCMNVGNGVPCTLRWIAGVGSVEEVPHTENTEMWRAQEAFKKKMSSVVMAVKKHNETIAQIMQKDRITKDDRAKVNELVDYVVREVHVNAPWWVEQFAETTGKVAAKAKAEVAAMFEHAIRSTGMQHIVSLRQASTEQSPELPAHEER